MRGPDGSQQFGVLSFCSSVEYPRRIMLQNTPFLDVHDLHCSNQPNGQKGLECPLAWSFLQTSYRVDTHKKWYRLNQNTTQSNSVLLRCFTNMAKMAHRHERSGFCSDTQSRKGKREVAHDQQFCRPCLHIPLCASRIL